MFLGKLSVFLKWNCPLFLLERCMGLGREGRDEEFCCEDSQILIQAHTCTHTHTSTHTQTFTRVHAHNHTHKHIHTHTTPAGQGHRHKMRKSGESPKLATSISVRTTTDLQVPLAVSLNARTFSLPPKSLASQVGGWAWGGGHRTLPSGKGITDILPRWQIPPMGIIAMVRSPVPIAWRQDSLEARGGEYGLHQGSAAWGKFWLNFLISKMGL